MPSARVVFYQEEVASAPPVLEWVATLPLRARAKVRAVIGLLEEQGHALRRPHADYLRDGIYELRARLQHTNYRVLYGFQGGAIVVLLHGIVKQCRAVRDKDIDLAIRRLELFKKDPAAHTFEGNER